MMINQQLKVNDSYDSWLQLMIEMTIKNINEIISQIQHLTELRSRQLLKLNKYDELAREWNWRIMTRTHPCDSWRYLDSDEKGFRQQELKYESKAKQVATNCHYLSERISLLEKKYAKEVEEYNQFKSMIV